MERNKKKKRKLQGYDREFEEPNKKRQVENKKLREENGKNHSTTNDLKSITVAHSHKSESSTSLPKLDFRHYVKRKGVVDKGKEYEILMCTLYALKCSTDDNVVDFSMTTNNEECDNFDDIELEVTFSNDKKLTYLFQLKHKENNKPVTQEMLTNEFLRPNKKQDKSKFYLVNYFKSMGKIKMEMENRDILYILYTNSEAELKDADILRFKQYNLKVSECNQIEHEDLLLNAEVKDKSIFQFMQEFHNETSDRRNTEKLNEKFYFFTKQRNLQDVKNDVREKLKNLVHCDEIYGTFEHFMKNWWSSDFVLTKHHVIMKLAELALSPYIKTLSAKKHNEKTKKLEEAIMTFELTIVEDNQDIAQDIWTETKTDCDWKSVLKVPLKIFFELGESKPSDIQTSKILWYLGKAPLVVKVDRSNESTVKSVLNLMQKDNQRKKILLLCDAKKHDFEGWDVFENLSDLKKKSTSLRESTSRHIYNELACNFRVSLQSKRSISLEELSRIDEKFRDLFRTADLFKISQTVDFLIGSKKEQVDPFYIPRSVSTYTRNIHEVLDLYKRENENVIIINCKDIFKKNLRSQKTNVVELSEYLNENNIEKYRNFIIVSTTNRCTCFQFDQLSERFKNVYVFQVLDDDSCFLVMKKGKKLFSETTEDKTYIEETKILNHFKNSLNVFCAPPGMGKSTLMKVLNDCCSPEFWTIRIELINYNNPSFAKNSEFENVCSSFLEFEEKDSLTREIKKLLLKNKKLYLFLDGLDEVDSRFVDHVINFAKRVSSEGYNVWISSRENLREKINQSLNVVPIEIKELDQEQQKLYIHNKLETKYQNEEIGKIVKTVYESADINNSQDLLGIPLQLHIITEMFLNNKDAYANLEQQNIFVLTQMYKLFFQGKANSVFEKMGLNEFSKAQLNISDEETLEKYERPALKSCLDSSDYEKLDLTMETVQKFLQTIKKEGDKLGIVKAVSANFETIFHHQTYAEYFVCAWFRKNKDKIKLLRDTIFSPRYENLRRIFDIMMAENNPLHLAIIYKNIELFNKNIDDLEKVDEGGRTALHIACSYGRKYLETLDMLPGESTFYLKIMEKLVLPDTNIYQEDDLFSLNCVDYANVSNCLYPIERFLEKVYNIRDLLSFYKYYSIKSLAYHSARFRYLNLLSNILSANPQFFKDIENYKFTLETAIVEDDYEDVGDQTARSVAAVKLVIEKCANLGIRDINSVHSFYLQFAYNIQMISLLIDFDADVNYKLFKSKQTILNIACRLNKTKIFMFLLEKGSDPFTKDYKDATLMHYASSSNEPNLDILNRLLNLELEVNAQNKDGKTPLHRSCKYGHIENTKWLLENGADLKIRNKKDRNALHYACKSSRENTEQISLLLSYGLDLNVRDKNGTTPLQLACSHGLTDVTKLLLAKEADPKIEDNVGRNILHYACQADKSNREIMSLLINHGVDVNVQDQDGESPLQLACEYGSLKELGFEVNAQDKNGNTSLHLSCGSAHIENTKLLLEKGADPNIRNNQGRNALHYVCEDGEENIEKISLLLSYGLDFNVRDKDGTTPLQLACINGHTEITKLLLAKGADPKIKDNEGSDSLHYACNSCESHTEIISLLINHGVDVNVQDQDGKTPLHYACYYECLENMKLLMEKGANPDILDTSDWNSLDYADLFLNSYDFTNIFEAS